MARPTLKGDIKFIQSEIMKGFVWIRKYFKDKSDDNKKGRIVSLLEFGPFKGLQLLAVIIVTFVLFFSFSIHGLRSILIVFVIIFVVIYDLFFGKGWIIPHIKYLLTALYEIVKDIVMGIFELVKDILLGVKDILMSFSPFKKSE